MGKRYKNLYEQIYTFENLWSASRKARRGKRNRNSVIDFEFDLEKNIFQIQEGLQNNSFNFLPYKTFTVFEPKVRLISAAPYRDRVVHQAVCNIIEPILDKAMIYDSYACRTGKGMHRAMNRAQQYLKNNSWVLKMDIKKYFFTINHQILLNDLKRKIKDESLLSLLENLLSTYNCAKDYYSYFENDLPIDRYQPIGLPIGNLTSQLFANYFLTPMDRFIKEELKVKNYVRYMDDFLLFSSDKANLKSIKDNLSAYLQSRRLKIHPTKTQIFPVKNGVNFLGYHLYAYHKRILKPNLIRFTKKFKQRVLDYQSNKTEFDNLLQSLNAWLGFADRVNNKKIINAVLSKIRVKHNTRDYEFSFILP